jgi:hypothetical protein
MCISKPDGRTLRASLRREENRLGAVGESNNRQPRLTRLSASLAADQSD